MRSIFINLSMTMFLLNAQGLSLSALAANTPAPTPNPAGNNKPEEKKPEAAPGQKEFEDGIKRYKDEQYQQAADLFWKAIVAGNSSAKVWVYCGQAHALSGNFTVAREKFEGTIKAFPGTQQATYAAQRLKELKDKQDKLIPDPPDPTESSRVPPIKPGSDLAKGIKSFQNKNYDAASSLIHSHLKKFPTDPNAHYYLALTHHYKGQTNKAILCYRKVVEISPDSKLGKQAVKVLDKVDPDFRGKRSSSQNKENNFEIGLVTKVKVLPPTELGRPIPLSGSTIDAVKNVCRNLPPHINKKLYDGGVTISVATNYKDRATHQTINDKHPTKPNVFLCQEPGRTYDKEVFIYERKLYMIDGELQPARSTQEIKHWTLHELGHALNNIDGDYIKHDTGLHDIFKKEIVRCPGNARQVLKEFLSPPEDALSEMCAEILCGLLGSSDKRARTAVASFPRTALWLKIRFNLQ